MKKKKTLRWDGKMVQLVVTEEEKAFIKNTADSQDISMNQYMRNLVNREMDKMEEKEE